MTMFQAQGAMERFFEASGEGLFSVVVPFDGGLVTGTLINAVSPESFLATSSSGKARALAGIMAAAEVTEIEGHLTNRAAPTRYECS